MSSVTMIVVFLRIRRPPRSTRTDTLFPSTTLFRAILAGNPSAISAGSVANVPPPASAFIAPPRIPAAAAKAICAAARSAKGGHFLFRQPVEFGAGLLFGGGLELAARGIEDRKSTSLNSSH